eukprot:6808701-Prymnesium_polylepis.2
MLRGANSNATLLPEVVPFAEKTGRQRPNHVSPTQSPKRICGKLTKSLPIEPLTSGSPRVRGVCSCVRSDPCCSSRTPCRSPRVLDACSCARSGRGCPDAAPSAAASRGGRALAPSGPPPRTTSEEGPTSPFWRTPLVSVSAPPSRTRDRSTYHARHVIVPTLLWMAT